jgi:hypothetical protein
MDVKQSIGDRTAASEVECKYCRKPIRPGQGRTPLASGGVMHDYCGIRASGNTEDWLFYCHNCGFATDKISVVQACPSCDSAETCIEPPAGFDRFTRGEQESVNICTGCYTAFKLVTEWRSHECNTSE